MTNSSLNLDSDDSNRYVDIYSKKGSGNFTIVMENLIDGVIPLEKSRTARKSGICHHVCCELEQPETLKSLHDNSIKKGRFCHKYGQKINVTSSLYNRFERLYQNQDFSDLQIIVGHNIFYVHKLILCLCSDVFKVMLTNPSWPESQNGTISLKEEGECVDVFENFLRFLYTGCIQLDHQNVLPILMLSDKYNVNDLQNVCIDYMCSHIVSIVENNRAISWFQYASVCGHHFLAQCCYDFILNNFHKVICTNDFLNMEKDIFSDFLQNSDLVIPDEYTLYKGVVRWLAHHEIVLWNRQDDFKELALSTLHHIRFSMMPSKKLRQLDIDPVYSALREFFCMKVTESMDYHFPSSDDHMHLNMSDSLEGLCRPRNYTSDTWGTILSIDNYDELPKNAGTPLLFSSPVSASEADDDHSWGWNLDIYPKGVFFQKCIMIGLWRNLEISGALYNTVRLTLEAKEPERRPVDVSILITGVQDGIEYYSHVVQNHCLFDKDNSLHHFDDLIPYDKLNCPNSRYLCGIDGNSFKITIVIKPA